MLNKTRILAELGVINSAEFDPAQAAALRIEFLQTRLKAARCQSFVLGISGGVDSFSAGRLAQLAVAGLRDEGYSAHFYAVRLPYDVQQDEDDAQLSLDYIKADSVLTVNIANAVDAIHQSVSDQVAGAADHAARADFVKGNVKARMRMLTQYEIANYHNGLVIGTDHNAEAITGFYTKFGDGACDVTPLVGLNKRQVRQLAEYLGAPEKIHQKIATADLEEIHEHRPDEDALGVSYQAIDDYLENRPVDAQSSEVIEGHFLRTRHKRRMPYTPIE